MVKIRMLVRHTGQIGKMEQGFEYLLPSSYAFELVVCGVAEFVLMPASPPVNVDLKPPKAKTLELALREMRVKNDGVIKPPSKKGIKL